MLILTCCFTNRGVSRIALCTHLCKYISNQQLHNGCWKMLLYCPKLLFGDSLSICPKFHANAAETQICMISNRMQNALLRGLLSLQSFSFSTRTLLTFYFTHHLMSEMHKPAFAAKGYSIVQQSMTWSNRAPAVPR